MPTLVDRVVGGFGAAAGLAGLCYIVKASPCDPTHWELLLAAVMVVLIFLGGCLCE